METKRNLSGTEKFGYSLGAVAKDMVYMLSASYVLYYFQDIMGTNAFAMGVILLAARIFDAFNDPIMGVIVAKTKTRMGKFRPWLLIGTITNAAVLYAMFACPPDLTPSGLVAYAAVTYILWGVTYTMMDIPFWSMIPAITEPGEDREALTSLARTCSGIGDAIPTVLTMTIVPILSASTAVADYRIGFRWWALIVAVVFVISELICVLKVPEKPIETTAPTSSVGQMFRTLFANEQAMTVVVSIILVYTSVNICGNLVLYFFQFDVGNEGAYSIFAAVAFAAQVLVMMIVPALRKKFTKAQLFVFGFLIQIAGFLVILAMAFGGVYTPENWYILCIPGIMIYLGYGMLNVIMTIFLSDSVDYGEVKNHTREESVIFSMQTFTVKLASGLAVFLAGIVVNLIHLETDAAVQSASTLTQLRMWMTIPSVLLLIVGIIVFKKCYKLDDAKMDEIKKILEERK